MVYGMKKHHVVRPPHANVGYYGTRNEGTCPSGNTEHDYGMYINVMLHDCKFQRMIDGRWVEAVIDVHEGGETLLLALDCIAEFYFEPRSYGDLHLRSPIVAQACAQLIGMAAPRTVAQFVLPIINDVINGVGIAGLETILYVKSKPMYAPEYAELIDATAHQIAEAFPADP